MEIENHKKEPTLEEYGLDANSYDNYRNQKNDLEESKPRYRLGFESLWLSIFGAIIIGGITESVVWGILFFVVSFIYLVIGNYKNKEITKKHLEIDDKLKLIKNNIYPFEEASKNHYEEYLDEFFKNNLYKKRSGSEKFEQSLIIFLLILIRAIEINKKLIFTNINLETHRLYAIKRLQDSKYQKYKNKLDILSKLERNNLIENKVINISDTEKEIILLVSPEKKYRVARRIDNWEEINKKKKETGDKGEEIVFTLEQEYFESINIKDLADKIRHVSVEEGDGSGYDILSFFDDGKEKYIEVKSTIASIESQFNISKNELEFLKEHNDDAFIYRVFFK